jgi:hypothetical protein
MNVGALLLALPLLHGLLLTCYHLFLVPPTPSHLTGPVAVLPDLLTSEQARSLRRLLREMGLSGLDSNLADSKATLPEHEHVGEAEPIGPNGTCSHPFLVVSSHNPNLANLQRPLSPFRFARPLLRARFARTALAEPHRVRAGPAHRHREALPHDGRCVRPQGHVRRVHRSAPVLRSLPLRPIRVPCRGGALWQSGLQGGGRGHVSGAQTVDRPYVRERASEACAT